MSASTFPSNPAARSHTALFVLLGKMSNTQCRKPRENGDRIEFPVNQPGQNAVECYTLAALAFILTAGLPTVVIGRSMGGHFWSFVLALPLGALLAFVTFHILFFGFAYIYRRLHTLHLVPSSAPQKLPEEVYLNFFTLVALAIVFSRDPILIAIATPWLAWFISNLLAGIVLFTGKIGSSDIGNSE